MYETARTLEAQRHGDFITSEKIVYVNGIDLNKAPYEDIYLGDSIYLHKNSIGLYPEVDTGILGSTVSFYLTPSRVFLPMISELLFFSPVFGLFYKITSISTVYGFNVYSPETWSINYGYHYTRLNLFSADLKFFSYD